MRATLSIVLPVVLTVTFSTRSTAVQPSPDDRAFKTLLGTRSLKCSFAWFTSAEWRADEPEFKHGQQQDFKLQIDGIDYSKGTARVIGNAGADDLAVVRGAESVAFLELTPVGGTNVTTVYGWRDKRGFFKAVHSRHTAIAGPSPSQHYGFCQMW